MDMRLLECCFVFDSNIAKLHNKDLSQQYKSKGI